MNRVKRSINVFLKESIGSLLLSLGVVYLVKYWCRKKQLLVIFNYHNFSKYNNYKCRRGDILEIGYASNFERQISFLKEKFQFSYPREFFYNEPENGLNVLCTFDDGYKDNYDIALPVLKKHKAKAIFFVVTGLTGKQSWLMHDQLRYLALKGNIPKDDIEKVLFKMNQGVPIPESYKELIGNSSLPEHRLMMNWTELETIKKSGFKVEPHTHSHPVLSFLAKKDQEQEIGQSIEDLKNRFGEQARNFAFPNGLFNEETIEILNASTIEFSLSTRPGINTIETPRHKLKRIGVNASDSKGVLLLKILLNIRK